jgi:hypothetical protein
MFVNWAKNYVALNQQGPALIIVYREGLSKQQTQVQVPNELIALQNVIKKIGQKTNVQNYNPEVVYTTVTTKINTRFFDFPQANSGNSNKFMPRV